MKTKSLLITTLGLTLFYGFLSGQSLKTASIFGDHMVIQQGINAPVWGTTKPRSIVTVEFAGFLSKGISDETGNWMIRMPVLSAGGPYIMKIVSEDTVIFNDVMVGEVWLASGQSNMEWTMSSGVGPNTLEEIAKADNPMIRYYNVARKTSNIPLLDMEKRKWTLVSMESVKELSAVSYFFARELQKRKSITVGIISSSWGATSAEAWISSEMLSAHPDFREKVLNADKDTSKWNNYVRNCLRAEQEREIIGRTSRKGYELGVMNIDYNDSDWGKCFSPLDMHAMNLTGYWGLVWLRKSIVLSNGAARKNIMLTADILARDAVIFINGKEIVHFSNPGQEYEVDIPQGVLNEGENVLTVRLFVNWGSAHFGSKTMCPSLVSSDNKNIIPIEGEWKYNSEIEPKVAQWQDYYNKPAVLFNARIAPLIPFGMRGVIWYQGENNAGNGYQYRSLFPLLIEDWRIRWMKGYFPFLYVQLANYKEKKDQPGESDWAELREAQLMTLQYPNTGMAVTIDLGDAEDIHPRNKLDVGKRLYLLARKLAYNEDVTASGPLYESYLREGNRIRIIFTSTGSGLEIRNGTELKGFSIAGPDNNFVWADAFIEGNDVVVSSSKVPEPKSVRYSWADNPDGNLYNKEGLPASPFRTDFPK